MGHTIITTIAACLLFTNAYAAPPQVAVTIYNGDLALVRETRNIDLKKGTQLFRYDDVPPRIDPTSVHFRSLTAPDEVSVLEQNYHYDLVETPRLLEKYVGRRVLASTRQGVTFSGTLMSDGGGDIILHLADGAVKVIRPDALETIEFPDFSEELLTKPMLSWLLACRRGGTHASEVSYLTGGLKWQTEYVAVSGPVDEVLELSGRVCLENASGKTYRNARLKLVAGDIHQAAPRRRPDRMITGRAFKAADAEQFKEKKFFEYHAYTLQRPATLQDRQSKQVSLFPATEVKAVKTYSYDGARDGKTVRVNMEFVNDDTSGLGMPLPAGRVRVYKSDDGLARELVGEDMLSHTPEAGRVRLYVGNAFDIVGERTVLSSQDVGRRTRRESVEIALQNRKKQAVSIAVVEHFYGTWKIEGDTPPIRKQEAAMVEFEITLPAGSEKTFEYTVLLKR